jgi:hypothetical protein
MADSKCSASCFMGFGPKKLADGFASETGPFQGGADSEQHDQHVLDWVAYWMANVKNQEAHPRQPPNELIAEVLWSWRSRSPRRRRQSR